MKQVILFVLALIFCVGKINAQTDSIARKDSSIVKEAASIKLSNYIKIDSNRVLAKPRLFYSSPVYIYNHSGYQDNTGSYNSTKLSITGITGNILLSIFADKTNHSYQPNYTH